MCAGFGFLVGFTLLLNFFAFLALKYYSGQQARASVSCIVDGHAVRCTVYCCLPADKVLKLLLFMCMYLVIIAAQHR
jgi:hypothetical protein